MNDLIGFLKKHWQKVFLIIICLIIIVTRFVPISFGDFYGDNAINSFRSYGWLDYFGTSGQTTPLQWFGNIPGWANLSFHDAPPLAFIIQWIFFAILGGGTVIARLPFVIAGILSIWLVYCLLKRLTNQKIASIATIFYTVSSYAIWAGQASYLEGIEELFIIGSVLYGAIYLFKDQNKKNIYIWTIFLTCALLTKYTAVFLIPPILFYVFLCRSEFKKQWKHVVLAGILFILLISPLIIYNVNLYQSRGHFDASLSSMVGIHSQDFYIIDERTAHYNVFSNTVTTFEILSENMSYSFLVLFIGCFILLILRIWKTSLKSPESWVLINLIFLLLVLGLAGAAVRFLSLIVPFMVIVIGLGTYYFYEKIRNQKLRIVYIIGISAIILLELIYSVNTNVLKKPISVSGWLYSENKIQSLGFNQIDSFIRSTVITKLPKFNVVKTKEDLIFNSDDVKGRSAIIFDDRINWFAQMWYFQRYFIYYRWPVISTGFLSALNVNKITIKDLMEVSGKQLYFVYPINDMVIDPMRAKDKNVNFLGPDLAKQFDALGATSTIIKNRNGVPVFKIYIVSKI
ncbi:MAG: glycosyltransferase family 39 protein [Candidatus Paceibacterota bacterium]|jgi:uncharacterized membrane protein